MMPDYPLGQTLDFKFTTRAFATGVPTVLAGSPVIEIYEDNSTTQITAAETLTVDFDSVVGLNNLRIVATSGNGFAAGGSYAAVISTGTVGGVSVVGEVVAQFSIERAAALMPTVAGRTLDVSAGGEAGIDWANVGTPGAAVDLSATTIDACDDVTGAVGSVAGNVDGSVASVTGAVGSVTGAVGSVTGNVGGNVAGSVDSVTGDTKQTADHTAGIAAIPTTAMRGTDNAALASVLGALNDVAAAGDVTDADTLMQYLKQVLNELSGTTGIGTMPAGANPANGTNLFEILRAGLGATFDTATDSNEQLQADVAAIPTTAMRGTDSAALASVCTEGRLAELDAANLPADVDTLLGRITATLFAGVTSLAEWLGLIAGNQVGDATARTELRATGAGSGTFDETADSNEAVRDQGDAAWLTATGFSTHNAAAVWAVATRVLTAGTNLNDLSTADIDARLAAIGLDHLLSASVVGADVADNSIFARLVSKEATADWDDFVNTTDALQALRDQGDAAWITATGFATAAKLLAYLQLLVRSDAAITTDNSTELGELNANEGSGAGDYAATTESQEAIRDRGDSAWITAVGFALASVCTEARLAELAAANLPADVDAILLDTDTTIPGLIAALNDLSAAGVNAEVVDVMFTDTLSELAQAKPAATPTFAAAMMLLYMKLRNRVDVTASEEAIYNDAGTVIATKALSDDGTTYTEAEMESGP